jgi:hypothetical protein
MYRDLNDFLVQRDVLPKITTTTRQRGDDRKTRVIIESEDGDDEASGADVFSTLRSLMTDPSSGVINRSGYPSHANLGTAPNATVPGGYLGIFDVAEKFSPVDTSTNATKTHGGTSSVGHSGVGILAASATANRVNNLTKLKRGNLSGLGDATATILDAAQIQAGNVNVLRTLKETGTVGEVSPIDDLNLDIVTILFDYWRQLLIITHVEDGVESEIRRDQLGTVDDLVWSIQDKPTPGDRKALAEKRPQLLESIKRGMATLEREPDVCSKFMSILASVHVESVKNTAEDTLAERHLSRGTGQNDHLTPEAQDNDEFVNRRLAQLFGIKDVGTEELDIDLSVFDNGPDPEPEPDQIPPDIIEFVNQVTELDLGDWIDFDSEDGSTMRARFTWISPTTERYLFTTRQGQKALDTTLTELADQFAKGVARRVDTKPDPIYVLGKHRPERRVDGDNRSTDKCRWV